MHDSFTRQQDGQRPVILFTNLPPLHQLFAITVRISNSLTLQAANRFQPQIIKCREFIFTEPDVIGTPSADVNDNCFYLVSQESVIKSGRIQARINKVGLQVSEPYQATPDLYQSCLKYTLQARISPNWNKAGQWFIQGRDFLTLSGCVNGIKMDLTMNQSELFFTLEATSFKTSPLKVDDLDIINYKLKAFLTNPAAQINHQDIGADWCFILPSMKKGRIMSITHEVPEECPFMSYRDLKRHWKNMYGYRLPEEDTGINYYQISFGMNGGKLFTYPEVCLRGRDLQRISRVDPKPIMRTFMQEIQSKFPSVCGFPFKLQSKAKFTSVDLQTGLETTPQTPANLTNKTSNTRPQLYRSKESMDRLMSTNTQQYLAADSKPSYQMSRPTPQPAVRNTTPGMVKSQQMIQTNRPLPQQAIRNTTPCAFNECQRSSQINRPVPHQSDRTTPAGTLSSTTSMIRPSETPHQSNIRDKINPPIRKLFPKFDVKKSLFKGPSSDQTNVQKTVPKFTPSQRPCGIVSASKKATLSDLEMRTPDPDKKTGVRFSEITSVKRFNTSPVTQPDPQPSQSVNKVTPRFFQKKQKSATTCLPASQTSQYSGIVRSKTATRDGAAATKQKSGKRSKTPKDGPKESKKKKLKKAED